MSRSREVSVPDFVNDPRVTAALERLKAKFPVNADGTSSLLVSDVLDDDGNQYVNLVQKGGGVLGVALVGYTYILEQMRIRFLKLAGTSAGAINTALMTVIKTKKETKCEEILEAISGLDFFKLVDGHPAARFIIEKFIKKNNFVARVKIFFLVVLSLFGFLIAGDIFLIGLQKSKPGVAVTTGIFFILTGLFITLIITAIVYGIFLLKRLKNAGFGINRGNYFLTWITELFAKNGITSVSGLKTKAAATPVLHLRVNNEMGIKGLEGDVAFITSELATQNKIQFPANCDLFRKPGDIDTLDPAGFVRASMSIPLFFESYNIHEIPCEDVDVKKAWVAFGVTGPPSTARFVDGGILSNFPISLFYNPEVSVPRLPVFGIDLDDTVPDYRATNVASWNLAGYLGRIFNTVRNYYDKDFLMKNRIYEKGIGKIDVKKYNWLNFFMTKDDKIDLFVNGVLAAEKFLEDFNWYDYKGIRRMAEEELETANA